MPPLRERESVAQVELHSLHLRDRVDVPDWILSEQERHRAAAFRSAEARRLFVAGRFLCRHILGDLLGCAPQALSIAITQSGRPYLSDFSDIDFNISHVRDRVALAICRGGLIGIDIERVDAFSEEEAGEIMPMILSEYEFDQVRQLDGQYRRDALLARWVQKEAALKCLGRGFLADPRCVTLSPDYATFGSKSQLSSEPIFINSGRVGDGEIGDFQWAIATSRLVTEPQWRHHINGISL